MVKGRDKAAIPEGLLLATKAAGSVRALARLLGMSAPSLLAWRQVPAHRVVQIEAVTGIPREKLRPDLYRALRKRRPKR